MKKYNLIIALKNTQQMEQILNKLNPYEMCQGVTLRRDFHRLQLYL